MKKETISLDFEDAVCEQLIDKDIRTGISSIARTGKYLWVAGDENISVQRLELQEDGSYGKAVSFFLKDYLELPSADSEADVEGMDIAGGYLWLVGSHSYKRKKMRAGKKDQQKEIDRLSEVSLDPNRNLLARIPIIQEEDGAYVLVKECPDPDNPEKMLRAAKLKHSSKKWSELTRLLKKDKHLGPFVTVPGKDNGLDIEGLTVYKDKIFLGLRGPVLRGWAIILEVQLKETKDNLLKLQKDEEGGYYKKHFINLFGMGIREILADGEDILVLAGPTMDLDGTMEILRWKQGTLHNAGQVVGHDEVESVLLLPYYAREHGLNKAEGFVFTEDRSLMITYDSPSQTRLSGDFIVKADVFRFEEEAGSSETEES